MTQWLNTRNRGVTVLILAGGILLCIRARHFPLLSTYLTKVTSGLYHMTSRLGVK